MDPVALALARTVPATHTTPSGSTTDRPDAPGSVAALPAARYLHTTVALSDGRFLVAGGYTSAATADALVYDPAANTWTAKAPMPTARYSLGSSRLSNGLILTTGGHTTGVTADCYRYDPAANTWTTVAALPAARHQHGHCAVQGASGTPIVMGGADASGNPVATVWTYDAGANTWTAKANMPATRTWPGAARASGRVLAVAGYSGGYISTVYAYDPAANTWASVANLPQARYAGGAASLPDGRVLYLGGVNTNGVNDAMAWVYDEPSNTWTPVAGLPLPRASWGGTNLPPMSDGRVFLPGGNPSTAEVRVYDPGRKLATKGRAGLLAYLAAT